MQIYLPKNSEHTLWSVENWGYVAKAAFYPQFARQV
jgi:hypothetical protein